MAESNPSKYYVVPFGRWEEGQMPSEGVAIVRASSENQAREALDEEIYGGNEDFWGEWVFQSDVFGGSSIERADDNFYYIAGFDPEYEDETPTYNLKVDDFEIKSFNTLHAAEDALSAYRFFGDPLIFRVDDRGGLQRVKIGSKSKKTKGTTKLKNPSDDIPVFTTGDVNAFEYGGGILYYQPEYDEMLWVFWDEPPEDAEEGFPHYVYMFRWTPGEDLLKSEFSWVKEEDIDGLCSSMDCDPSEFRRWARGNIIEQLMVAENVRWYWGAQNLDHEPFQQSEAEVRERYEKDFDKAVKNNADKAIEIVEKARSRRGKELKAKLLR